MLISGNRLQLGAGNDTACCRVWYCHNANDRVCMLRPIQASGKYKEAKRESLASEDENQQVRAHCPVVIDKARPFLALARRLLPRNAGFVDQKSKQYWSRYHSYKHLQDKALQNTQFNTHLQLQFCYELRSTAVGRIVFIGIFNTNRLCREI